MSKMRSTLTLLVFCIASCLLLAKTTQGQATAVTSLINNLNGCVPENEFQTGLDYFPEKFAPTEYSPNFLASDQFIPDVTTNLLSIEYYNTYKIVTNKYVNKTYLLYQCGTVPPADQLDGRHHLVLPIPHKGGIAVTETPQVVPLEMLGKRNEIIAYMTDPEWLASPCLNALKSEGKVEVVYDNTYNTTKTNELRAEFLQRHPDAIIYGETFGDPTAPRTLAVSYTQERTNVATFDWLALHAALFNLERESNRIAAETKARYECSSGNARLLSADVVVEERPQVLWATYFNGYNWSMGECPTWNHTWYCELAEHCGVEIINRPENVGTNQDGYWYLDDEQLLTVGKDADIFFFPIYTWDEVYARSKVILDQFKSVQNKQVYDILGQGNRWAWSEQRAFEYDVVALDFCEIVGNGNHQSQFPHEVKWFRNAMENETSAEFKACKPEELYEPYIPSESLCRPLTADFSAGTIRFMSMTALAFGVATLMFVV